jgi:hypothetical protein
LAGQSGCDAHLDCLRGGVVSCQRRALTEEALDEVRRELTAERQAPIPAHAAASAPAPSATGTHPQPGRRCSRKKQKRKERAKARSAAELAAQTPSGDQDQEGGSECPLCLSELMGPEQEEVEKTSCGHLFHGSCLGRWRLTCQARAIPYSCPYCRTDSENSLDSTEFGIAAEAGAVLIRWPLGVLYRAMLLSITVMRIQGCKNQDRNQIQTRIWGAILLHRVRRRNIKGKQNFGM